MPKSTAKRSAPRKAAKKPVKKKTLKKTITKKKAAPKKLKKKALKKKATRKKATKKTIRKNTGSWKKPATRRVKEPPSNKFTVEPGPPSGSVPSVEEPALHEEAIGTVTHYYSHLSVAIVQINKGRLAKGDTVHISGHSTDFTQTIESMEYEHQHVDQASPGQSVGILVINHARQHDIVYLVK